MAEARRIALAAQGFARSRPAGQPDKRHFASVLKQLGLLQLDYVNVLVPAHYLVIWSRLGRYDRQRFDKYIHHSGHFTEQWAHEASIVPVELWPLLAHRRANWAPWKSNPLATLDKPDRYLEGVLDYVRCNGAVTATDLTPADGPKRKPGEWHRSMRRWALEHHFGRGALTVRERKPNFQRIYDLPERVIPSEFLHEELSADDARCELLRRAADALGIASLHDLADYYRMSPRTAAPLVQELVDAGQLMPVAVQGWSVQGYLAPRARIPRRIEGSCLLSPFDPLVWYRPRAERLFKFHYRIEIYVPERKRQWGYYVLPFRLGDDIVARVDLKAERKRSALQVKAGYLEEGNDATAVAAALASELHATREWLDLEHLEVVAHNGFTRRLRSIASAPG
jgi:hypothetical protein